MRVGDVQDARIAEAFEIVNAGVVGGGREPRQSTRQRGSAGELEEIPAADGHAMSPRLLVIARSSATKQSSVSRGGKAGLLRGPCHRARVRATRWLAMTVSNVSFRSTFKKAQRISRS